jgi:glyoxylase-like metal-dependent hydrolase (beta-lactamase superfamily II)
LALILKDIKYVISTHAHGDHMGGHQVSTRQFPRLQGRDAGSRLGSGATKALRPPIDIGFDQETKLTLGD